MLYDCLILFFLYIKASVKLEAAVRPNNPNGLAAAFNRGNLDFNNGPKNLINPPICILVNCAFDNLMSVHVWLAKALRRFATYLLVNNNL